MAEKPTCSRCGVPHWRFVKCEAAAPAAPSAPVLVVHQSRDGFRPRGDYTGDYERVGNTFRRRDARPSDYWRNPPKEND